jgi:hypothetical protein
VNLPGISGWFNGDFNYDGKVNVDDYGIIDFNVGIQGPPLSSAPPADQAEIAQHGAAVLPLLSKPMPSLGPPVRDRDVFDSIFTAAAIL